MKPLHYVNLFGVVALAVLCVAQWHRDRELNLEVNRMEKVRFDHESKLAEQQQTLSGLNADLVEFKEQFATNQAELAKARQQLRTGERETRQLTGERDQLKSSVTNWAAAVTSRDQQLNEANGQVRKLANELNASIRKFNELGTNHNSIVKELNELRARQVPPQ